MDETTILAGAHFQIWDQAKTQVLREGTVDATMGKYARQSKFP